MTMLRAISEKLAGLEGSSKRVDAKVEMLSTETTELKKIQAGQATSTPVPEFKDDLLVPEENKSFFKDFPHDSEITKYLPGFSSNSYDRLYKVKAEQRETEFNCSKGMLAIQSAHN